MVKNLIQRLKDEAINEKNRNEYCTTEETKKQEARASKKKAIKKYEIGLEKSQEDIAEARAQIAELEKTIKELKKSCGEQNGQLQFDIHMHNEAVTVAQHGVEALEAVMAEMGNFFSDAN
jgi:predicted RNase H-like nuclease (RuvC/YqgF family)